MPALPAPGRPAGHLASIATSALSYGLPPCPPAPAPPPAKLEELMKEKSDRFEEMFDHESRLRLDESGWRER